MFLLVQDTHNELSVVAEVDMFRTLSIVHFNYPIIIIVITDRNLLN